MMNLRAFGNPALNELFDFQQLVFGIYRADVRIFVQRVAEPQFLDSFFKLTYYGVMN